MREDNDAVTEPDDDLSEAARRLGDRFLADEGAPEVTYDAATDWDSGYIVPSPEGAVSWRDAVQSDELDTGGEPVRIIVVDLREGAGGSDQWRRFATLIARARLPLDAPAPTTAWERSAIHAVAQSRAGPRGSASIWTRLAEHTNVDLRMVVQDAPAIRPPPSLGAGFSWDAMAESVDVDFRLLVPDDPTDAPSQWTDRYRLDTAEPGVDSGWRTLSPMDGTGAAGTTPVSGAIGWNLSLKGDDGGSAETAESTIPVPDASFAPDNFLQTPFDRPAAPIPEGVEFDVKIGEFTADLTFKKESRPTELTPEQTFSIDEQEGSAAASSGDDGEINIDLAALGTAESAPLPTQPPIINIDDATGSASDEGAETTEETDPAWDAEVARANARLEGLSNLDHETGRDEESGRGLDEEFGRDEATPIAPDGASLDSVNSAPVPVRPPSDQFAALDRELAVEATTADADSALPPTPPETSVLDFVEQEPVDPPPVRPDQSVLDTLDADDPPRRGPTSPFDAIDRELEAERRAEEAAQKRAIPLWIWPAAAAAVLAIGAFLFWGGGDDEPQTIVGGSNGTPVATTAAPAAATAVAPASTATATSTVAPSPAATMTAVQIPTLRICPDGSSFSGFEQPDGSFLDAETNEPRVCPPPPD